MSAVVRLIRFTNHESPWWPIACIAIVGIAIWRHHDPWSLATLLSCSAVLFVAPFFFRHTLIRNYARVRRGLNLGTIILIIALVVSRDLGHGRIVAIVFGTYCVFILGVLFWCASDSMMEMMNWLAVPTEYGRLPDEIYLVDERRFPWPDEAEPVECCLFKFRYDDRWDYGITGPVTFSMSDRHFEGKSAEEIYAAYARWYEQEGIGKMIDKEVEGDQTPHDHRRS
jgi:hypothetical protein